MTCRWAEWNRSELEEWRCHEPLVLGFGEPPLVGSWRFFGVNMRDWKAAGVKNDQIMWRFPSLCGPEKALWQPKEPALPLPSRIIAFFGAMLDDYRAVIVLACLALIIFLSASTS